MPSLGNYDPLAHRPVTDSEINSTRDRLEQEPVLVSGVLVQCDPQSENRLREHIEFFDDVKQDDGKVYWKLADNSRLPCTQQELKALLLEMRRERTRRFAQLHTRAEELKARLASGQTVTQRDIADSNW